jgi:hypothetical protein
MIALADLAKKFDLPDLAGVVQIGQTQSSYALKLKDGRQVNLGSSNELQQQSKVRAQLFDANAIMPKYNRDQWDEILRNIRLVVEIRDIGSDAEEMRDFIKVYFGLNRSFNSAYGSDNYRNGYIDFENDDKLQLCEELRQAYLTGFIDAKTGSAFLALGRFLERLFFISGQRFTMRDLKHRLSALGFTSGAQKSVRFGKGKNDVYNPGRYWKSPDGFLPPATR